MKNKICPKCSKTFEGTSVLSRCDNKLKYVLNVEEKKQQVII